MQALVFPSLYVAHEKGGVYLKPSMGSLEHFLKFVFGFTLFIGVSFGLTYTVTQIDKKQTQEEQTAAAFEAMLK